MATGWIDDDQFGRIHNGRGEGDGGCVQCGAGARAVTPRIAEEVPIATFNSWVKFGGKNRVRCANAG